MEPTASLASHSSIPPNTSLPDAPEYMGEGLRMDTNEALGRFVVATRAFAIGELVMQDQPLVVYTSGDEASFLRAFSKATPAAQAAILDMCHPDLDQSGNALVSFNRGRADELCRVHGMEAEHIHKLLMIREMNGHQYTGHETVYGDKKSEKAALFSRGSKVAHSCRPNLAYTSKTRHGGLEYRACRPIAPGEMITFSYDDELWTKNTLERRTHLLETKNFICNCPRCQGLDDTSAVCCPRDACVGFARPDISPGNLESTSGRWVCGACGPLDAEAVAVLCKHERSMLMRLLPLKAAAYESTGNDVASPSAVRAVAEGASKLLSPAHWIVSISYELLSTFCVHHATAAKRAKARGVPVPAPHGSEAELHSDAAEAAARHVRICECIAAQCCGGGECEREHTTVHECAKAVFVLAHELRQLKPRQRSAPVVALVERYLPHIEILYGKGDMADVLKMLEETSGKPKPDARSEAEMAADWLGGMNLVGGPARAAPQAVVTPRSNSSEDRGSGAKKKGKKGKR